MVSVFSGEPLVRVENTGPEVGQMSCAEAKQMGFQFIGAAIEAEREAGTVAFLRAKGFDDAAVGTFLGNMREHRKQATLRAVDHEQEK